MTQSSIRCTFWQLQQVASSYALLEGLYVHVKHCLPTGTVMQRMIMA